MKQYPIVHYGHLAIRFCKVRESFFLLVCEEKNECLLEDCDHCVIAEPSEGANYSQLRNQNPFNLGTALYTFPTVKTKSMRTLSKEGLVVAGSS